MHSEAFELHLLTTIDLNSLEGCLNSQGIRRGQQVEIEFIYMQKYTPATSSGCNNITAKLLLCSPSKQQ